MRAIYAVLTIVFSSGAFAASPELTIELRDFATMPITGAVDGPGNAAGLLARISFLREEPGVRKNRLFVNDLNGPLYIVDKETKQVTTYLHLNGLDGQPGIFHRLVIDNLLASGFISFEFDPDYARNGKFYTIHVEDPTLPGARHYLKFDPRAGKELVLVPDPLAPGGENFGSYFVFRKLDWFIQSSFNGPWLGFNLG